MDRGRRKNHKAAHDNGPQRIFKIKEIFLKNAAFFFLFLNFLKQFCIYFRHLKKQVRKSRGES